MPIDGAIFWSVTHEYIEKTKFPRFIYLLVFFFVFLETEQSDNKTCVRCGNTTHQVKDAKKEKKANNKNNAPRNIITREENDREREKEAKESLFKNKNEMFNIFPLRRGRLSGES